MLLKIKEIISAVKGELILGDINKQVKGVSINSKNIKKNNLFVAIKGRRFDGHDYIIEAAKNGVSAIVVSRVPVKVRKSLLLLNPQISVIVVDDTIKALGLLARMYRSRFDVDVIAITGTAGKTTTKEILANLLKSSYKVLSNKGTENNHIGVPLTLFKIKKNHEIVIVELGTNMTGDIKWLTYIAKPNIAIFTNIGEGHLELLGTPSRVFREKFNLAKGLMPKGKVIYNADDNYLRRIPSFKKDYKCISYGMNNKCDFQASGIKLEKPMTLHFNINKSNKMMLKTPSIAFLYNTLAAVSCAKLFNISYNDIRINLSRLRFDQSRFAIKRIGKSWLIDDSYNSNPVSFRNALKTLDYFNSAKRKVLICADMLELGKKAESLHVEIGKLINKLDIDLLLTYGDLSINIFKEFKEKDASKKAFHNNTIVALHRKLSVLCRPGDVILIKGSRGMHLERTVEYINEKMKIKLKG